MKTASKIFNVLNFFFSLAAIASLIWFHGYTYQPEFFSGHLLFIHLCFAFYFIQFIFRGYESGNLPAFIARNWTEYILFLLMILSMLVNWFLDFSLVEWLLSFTGIHDSEVLYILFLHIWLLLIVGIEMGKAALKSTIWRLSPPLLFIISFLVLIAIGSSLLMLPEMTADGQGMSFVDALFTSVSANCVTGLAVVDTATFFSHKGHFLIMLLIQMGGLNIIFFATFFISRYHEEYTTRHHDDVVQELFHTNSLQGDNMYTLLRRVAITTLVIEFVGVLIIYNQWGGAMAFEDNSQRIFFSVFHAISAFNNAGFTLFTDGLTNDAVVMNHSFHMTIALLIIVGGIGFTTIWDLSKRFRGILRWEIRSEMLMDTKVAVVSTLGLLLVGGVVFYLFESGGVLVGDSAGGEFTASFFQSVTARTAGFNTVDIGALGTGAVVLMLILMFIGTCSGATGGGIKTSTVAVLFFAALRRIRGADRTTRGRFVSTEMIQKGTLIMLSALLVILLGAICLNFTEPEVDFGDLLFEEVSAFGTVGLSRGLTPELSVGGKGIVMATMLIGRVGPLALAYALVRNRGFHERTRVDGFMIG